MFELFFAEFRRSAILLKRYMGNTIGSILGITIVFLALFFGAKYMSGLNQFGDRLDSIVVGYTLWALILFILADISSDTSQEAQSGTLEQVCLSPYGLTKIFVLRTFSNTIWMVLSNAIILTLIVLLTKVHLHISVWVLVPVVTTILAAYGLAFLFGALALGAKKVQQLLNLVNFGLLFLMMTPFEQSPALVQKLLSVLPLVPSAIGLRDVMVRGESLPLEQIALMLANGLLWFALGVWVFRKADRGVRLQGVLNSY
ncbi:ABC transporter permease [Deinococcus roseus]|uniref:ABC transporter ATP-binding protein n=1 Tax=Deinococcus roseus TaxID=392414 RepID=A0ABQ2DE90_9DEIO|nr:ABC transporter permease [Deinococcus roseus]GGJ54851.1 ABC transporter ATP-binding protein [Deinococcus roseus]